MSCMITFSGIQQEYQQFKAEFDDAILSVLNSGAFINGDAVAQCEKDLSDYSGARYAMGCGNGTDALILALMAIDIQPGDEIITTPFSFVAVAEAIVLLGATPVFVDIDPETFLIDHTKIEAEITAQTKAIIPVSLFGQMADMGAIHLIAQKYDLVVIEDGAQSFGATFGGKKSCNCSILATTSFFPAKPLGCYGDGGAVFTSDIDFAQKIKALKHHGSVGRYNHQYIGLNSRLDTIQAAILSVKLRYYDEMIQKRQQVARWYDCYLPNQLSKPLILSENSSVYAQYTIQIERRDCLSDYLKKYDIPSAVHYPTPIHLQPAYRFLGYRWGDFPVAESASGWVLSLPLHPYVSEEQVVYIAERIKGFLRV